MSLVCVFLLVALLAVGCGGNGDDAADDAAQDGPPATVDTTNDDDTTGNDVADADGWVRPAETLNLEWYSDWGQRGGISDGWFYQMIYDRFNITINRLDDPMGGEVLFQTRAAAGNLGDFTVVGGQRIPDMVTAGLLQDITEYVEGMYYYAGQFPRAVEHGRRMSSADGRIFAIPMHASSQPVTNPALDGTHVVRGPYLRWDAYYAIGAPTINTLEDLLPVLRDMMEAVPYTETGRRTWGINLWSDWDSQGMANALWFDQMYDRGAWGDMMFIRRSEDTWESWLDDGGLYHRILRFYFEANQMGVLDPDSATQDWDMALAKANEGAIMFSWYSWYGMGFNTMDDYDEDGNFVPGRVEQGIGYQFVPIMDQQNVVAGMNPLGAEGQFIGIGPNVTDVQRLIDFLDWLSSPEIVQTIAAGPQGLTWDMVNGEPTLTDFGFEVDLHVRLHHESDVQVPAEWGGGSFGLGTWGGNLAPVSVARGREMNPVTGFPYDPRLWDSLAVGGTNLIEEQWSARFNSPNVLQFLEDNNMLVTTVATDFVITPMPSDLYAIRQSLDTVMRVSPWRMIFASNEAEFDSIWREWQETALGLGWQELVDFHVADIERYWDVRREARIQAGG